MRKLDMIDENFKPSEELSWRDVNDELVVLNLKSGEYYTFNDIGRFIWLELSNGKSTGEISELVLNEYNVDRGTAESDVQDFMAGLVEKRILVKVGQTEKG